MKTLKIMGAVLATVFGGSIAVALSTIGASMIRGCLYPPMFMENEWGWRLMGIPLGMLIGTIGIVGGLVIIVVAWDWVINGPDGRFVRLL